MPRNLKANEDRFWDLIAARRRGGDARDAIDARIWDLFGDEWAIMFTDLSGFSRQVAAFGIIHFLQVISREAAAVADRRRARRHPHQGRGRQLPHHLQTGGAGARVRIAMQRVSEAEPPAAARGEGAVVRRHRLRPHPAHRRQRRVRPGGQRRAKLGEDIARAHETLVTAPFAEAGSSTCSTRHRPIASTTPPTSSTSTPTTAAC